MFANQKHWIPLFYMMKCFQKKNKKKYNAIKILFIFFINKKRAIKTKTFTKKKLHKIIYCENLDKKNFKNSPTGSNTQRQKKKIAKSPIAKFYRQMGLRITSSDNADRKKNNKVLIVDYIVKS